MSLGARASTKGGTRSGGQLAHKHNHTHAKNTDKAQSISETQRASRATDSEEAGGFRQKVQQLMEMTHLSEEEACSALHDCDQDINKACDMIYEETDRSQGQWQTKEKKKKKVAVVVGAGDAAAENWDTDKPDAVPARPAPRTRSAPRPAYRGRGGDFHTGGEEQEASRGGVGPRRGGGRGAGRGGGRGAGRGGRAPRGPPRVPRAPRQEVWGQTDSSQNNGAEFPSPDEWDNEWSGSLADTKVFTPSGGAEPPAAPLSSIEDGSEYLAPAPVADLGSSPSPALTQDPAIYGYTNSTHHIPKAQSPVALSVSGTLSAAQSQYLSQLTQKSEALKQDSRLSQPPDTMLSSAPLVYSSNYGVYGSSDMASQRKPLQRARVPPPSKIPSSAVEMPGDLGGPMGLLDVQFGALDFNSDGPSFLADPAPSVPTNDKFNLNNSLEHSLAEVPAQPPSPLAALQPPPSLANDVSYATSTSTPSQMQLTSESLSAAVAVEQSGTAAVSAQYAAPATSRPAQSAPAPQLPTVSSLESQLTGSKVPAGTEASGQQSVYSSYPGQTYKQPYHPPHHYPANPYSQQVNSNATSFTAASSISSGSVSYPPSNTLNQYQHSQPINTYQNSSASVYGNNALYTPSTVPYNNYQTLQTNSNKISSNVKESQYETAVTSTGSLSNTPSAQSTQSSSKISTTSGSGKVGGSVSGVMNSGSGHVGMPYIMGQHFYAQQPLPTYSYEEMQILQQRLPHHMTAGYYEMGYGGSGASSARDASLPSFAALSSDARFSRGDAPSPSPAPQPTALLGAAAALQPYAYFYSGGMVPAGSFQPYSTPPMYPMATAGSTGSSSYTGAKGVNVGGGGYVGAAAAYAPAPQPAPPQPYEPSQPAAPQPQHNSHQQDYKSGGGYTSAQQSSGVKQGGGSSSAASASDLNNSMYGGNKAHASLNKSYDKAAYHSATPPPPFGLSAAAGGVAGAGYAAPHQMYIPHQAMPPPHQHQMEGRANSHRRDNGTNSSRGGSSGQTKQGGGAKQGYSPSYWSPN